MDGEGRERGGLIIEVDGTDLAIGSRELQGSPAPERHELPTRNNSKR